MPVRNSPEAQERKDRIREMWVEGGLSGAEIGKLLGVSKNTIAGHVHRLGLKPRARSPAKPRRVKASALKPPAPLPPPPPEAPPSLNLDIEQLTAATCRYPLGSDAPYSFCGHEPKPGRVYCPFHCLVAYQPLKPYQRQL